MSAALYSECVIIGLQGGTVRRAGSLAHLHGVPQIPGLPDFRVLDWRPEVHVALIQPQYEGVRDMLPDEVEALLAWVAGLQ